MRLLVMGKPWKQLKKSENENSAIEDSSDKTDNVEQEKKCEPYFVEKF